VEYWKRIPPLTWLFLAFALVTLLVGIVAMNVLDPHISGEGVAAFVTAVFAVVAGHVGHLSGHQLALEKKGNDADVGHANRAV
jgi:hypothetical protein